MRRDTFVFNIMPCRCMRYCHAKFTIYVAAAMIIAMGIGVIASCITARRSDKFEKMSTMMSAEANDALDFDKAALAMLIVGLVAILGSACGLWGAVEERRGPVCFFACFATLLGLLFVSMTVAMLAFLKSTYPTIVKETNRICRDPQASANLFKCNLPQSQQTTPSPPVFGEQFGTVNTQAEPINRRLVMVLLTQSLIWKHPGSLESFPMSLRGMGGNMSSWKPSPGRSLSAGTTEEHFLTSICDRLKTTDDPGCASECQLIAELCRTPDGFNPITACVCDSLGPRRYKDTGVFGEVGNSFVKANCPASMQSDGSCQGGFCSIPPARQAEGLEEEGCWVLPTTQCQGGASQPYPGGDLQKNPFWSSEPCTNPDTRSKVVLEGYYISLFFVGFTGALGFCMLLSSLCSCCLVCELHTNKRPDQHARDVLFGQDTSSDSGGDE